MGCADGLALREPRWRRYTAKIAMVPTARNSDCQFWSERSQKSGSVRYLAHETSGWWCVTWSLL